MDTIGLMLPIGFGLILLLSGAIILLNPDRIMEWRSRNVELMELTRKGVIRGGISLLLTGIFFITLSFIIIFVIEPIRLQKDREVEAQIERAIDRELESSFEKIRKELEEED